MRKPRFRPQQAALEGRCAEVHARLVEDEVALAAVKPEATASAYERWLPPPAWPAIERSRCPECSGAGRVPQQ